MNTIENFIESTVQLLQRLEGAPAIALVLVSCLVVGYALRMVPKFPNNAIPVAVILWGAVINPVLQDAAQEAPLRIWMLRGILIGMCTGFGAWIVHAQLLSRIEERFGLFNGKKNETTPPTPTPAPGP